MSTPPEDNLLSRFLDDYFAECDEHLSEIRANALALEQSLGRERPDAVAVGGLFRSFHTLKGLSGMVGFPEAARLAHVLESYLAALRDHRTNLSADAVETFIAGIQGLEGLIGAKRNGESLPDVQGLVGRLENLLQRQPDGREPGDQPAGRSSPPVASELPESGREALRQAREGGDVLWEATFTPAPELAARGVNVNLVRSRLEKLGRIVHAAPRVLPSGGVAFDFLVAIPPTGAPPADWAKDGMKLTRHETPPGCEEETKGGTPEPQDAPAPFPPSSAALTPSNVVRVDLGRLDEIMRLIGELVVSRARLEDGLAHLEKEAETARARPLQEVNLSLERQIRDLREAVMRIRLVPVGEIFNRMPFVVRDAAREKGKRVRLELIGQETEIDKLIVERMMDPLLHLVRNAISHGFESPDERRMAGKAEEGCLQLRAGTEGDLVVLEVEDDGVGMHLDRIAALARSQGLLRDGEELDGKKVLDILCAPGFSTRTEADLTSGRGVGLTVVRDTVTDLGGSLTLTTTPGKGTCFTLRLPLTLAIADALIAVVGGQTFAIQQSLVREVIEIAQEEVTTLERNEVIAYRNEVLPLVRLARYFHLPEADRPILCGLVVGTGLSGVTMVVDRIVGRREIVVRALTDPLLQVAGISGATELGDGRVVLILDPFRLLRERVPVTRPAQG